MARKKSVNDILDQYGRIYDGTINSNSARLSRAYDIADRYIGNIRKAQKTKQNMFYDREDVMRRQNNIKYSQRTYMGLSNG